MVKEEVKRSKQSGMNAEKVLDVVSSEFDELLDKVEDSHPELYECVVRRMHEKLSGPHYDKAWAEIEVQNLAYTNREKQHATGPHWTMEQVLEATRGKVFPAGTTDYDKYVAYNAAYADFCTKFDDQQILDIAYLFFFADEDWTSQGKVWRYMAANK